MGGARIELQVQERDSDDRATRGVLVVVFPDGTRRTTRISVSRGMSTANVRAAVQQAKDVAIAMASQAHLAAVSGINVSTAGGSIHTMLLSAEDYERVRGRGRGGGRRPAAARRPAAGRPARPAREAPREAPRPTISISWIERQLRDARGSSDRTALGAATALHRNRLHVEEFLEPTPTRGRQRTPNQKAATIAVFNTLYQIPRFRLFLSAEAATTPEYTALQGFLTAQPEASRGLNDQASDAVILAADMFIRNYLYGFEARESGGIAPLRQEIAQLDRGNWRMTNLDRSGTPSSDPGQEETRLAFRRLYIHSPMDADTLTTTALYTRRWYQEHPASGRGRAQARISVWSAPEVLQPQPEAPAQPAAGPVERHAAALRNPSVGIIGASLVAGGSNALGRELQRLIRTGGRTSATVSSYGRSGNAFPDIRRRFESGFPLTGSGAHNIVVISGWARLNDGRALSRVTSDLEAMFTRARQAGALVVVFGVGPHGGHRSWSARSQQRADALNSWLRQRQDIVFVDTSSLGTGRPPRLRREYDSGDGLHLGVRGSNELARLIHSAIFERTRARAAAAGPQRSPLQEYAHRNWQNLTTEIFDSCQRGRPRALIELSRSLPEEIRSTLPSGRQTFEHALMQLQSGDPGHGAMEAAFERLFNEVYHNSGTQIGTEFLSWARGQERYQGIARDPVRLTSSSSRDDRLRAVEAVQAFLNDRASRSDDWLSRYGQDLRILSRQVFSIRRDSLQANGVLTMATLTAISLYAWRRSNRAEAVGRFARDIEGLRITTPESQPAVREPEQGGRRRRVLPGL